MEAVFKLIWTTSFYAGFVGIILIFLKAVLKNKISPNWHYLLWIILVVKLLIPFGPESAFSLFNIMQPVAEEMNFAQSYGVGPLGQAIVQDEYGSDILAYKVTQDSARYQTVSYKKIIPYLWFFGAAILLIWLFYAHYSLARRLKTKENPVPEEVFRILEGCQKTTGVKRKIGIVIQDIVPAPSIIGILRPKILLTPDILNSNRRELNYILLHELVHYRRKDLAANYLLLFLQVIHWFNPVVWVCFRRIRQDMEAAADERVLRLLDPSEHKDYGRALLKVLETYSLKIGLAPRLVGMVDDRKNMERRIRMIKMADFFQSRRRRVIFTGILCLVVLGSVLWTSASAQGVAYEIGDFSLQVPSAWDVQRGETELLFEKDHRPIGGVQILNYEPGQPLFLPNHSETKSEKEIKGLLAKSVLINLDLTQPAASGDEKVKNENHLYLIFEAEKRIYDFYADTTAVSGTELVKIAKSLKKRARSDVQPKSKLTEYNLELLLENQTDYVGNNVKVVNLLSALPLPYERSGQEVSLQTDKEPYGITAAFNFHTPGIGEEEMQPVLRRNAAILFALINNVDVVNLNWRSDGQGHSFTVTRAEVQESYPRDLREYGKDAGGLEILINSTYLALAVFPEKYTPAMSSVPGIKLQIQYPGTAEMVKYSVDEGSLLTWDSISGKISPKGKTAELSVGFPVYWSPIEDSSVKSIGKSEIPVHISIRDHNETLAERQLIILNDSNLYSVKPAPEVVITATVQPAEQAPESIEEAVHRAVIAQGQGYRDGEVVTEGHIILEVEENNGIIKAYTVASLSWFGFENGVFTGISGSGAIPTVMTFTRNYQSNYTLTEYKEPMDGEGYGDSIRKMFPQRLWDSVLKTDHYPALAEQKEDQARQYLQSINRNAEVKVGHVEKQLADINVDASNKLFTVFTKSDPELNNFPYWLGTKEYLADGERFIYHTSQSKTADGYDLILFTKTREDGGLVLEYRFKIVGSEPQLLERRVFMQN